jgi:esterase/lipase superfamily enzyme
MERHEIAVLLKGWLESIRHLERAVGDASDGPMSNVQQSAARALLVLHARVVESCYRRTLHYKTRGKLLRLVDQADVLVALCRLLEQDPVPEPFNPQLLRVELVTMCQSLAQALDPVVRYYAQERPHGARGIGGGTRFKFQLEDRAPDLMSHRADLQGTPTEGLLNFEISPAEGDAATVHRNTTAKSREDQPQRLRIGPTEVPVYFGTTRSSSNYPEVQPNVQFLNGRGSGKLTLGRALISIPPGHRLGKFEQPFSIWKFRLKPNPAKHIVLRSVEVMDTHDWVSTVRTELDALPARTAFVFIHGFNVTFSEAMMRAGQIARDIAYEGLVTAFSWGSEGTLSGYAADEDAVQLAVPELVEFLGRLRTDAGVEAFHIVAHSMGCRALLSALKVNSWWGALSGPVTEAVFAAPDVDATQYRQSILAIPNNAVRYTLYGSERDWAIALSRSIRKNHPRAGDGGSNILVMSGVDTVDASKVGEHLFGLGHSYIADKRTILGDLWAVVRGLALPRFGLEQRPHQAGTYWVLLP